METKQQLCYFALCQGNGCKKEDSVCIAAHHLAPVHFAQGVDSDPIIEQVEQGEYVCPQYLFEQECDNPDCSEDNHVLTCDMLTETATSGLMKVWKFKAGGSKSSPGPTMKRGGPKPRPNNSARGGRGGRGRGQGYAKGPRQPATAQQLVPYQPAGVPSDDSGAIVPASSQNDLLQSLQLQLQQMKEEKEKDKEKKKLRKELKKRDKELAELRKKMEEEERRKRDKREAKQREEKLRADFNHQRELDQIRGAIDKNKNDSEIAKRDLLLKVQMDAEREKHSQELENLKHEVEKSETLAREAKEAAARQPSVVYAGWGGPYWDGGHPVYCCHGHSWAHCYTGPPKYCKHGSSWGSCCTRPW